MKVVIMGRAWEDYLHWQKADAAILERLNTLINACRRDPFRGKPEPLKADLKGWWSRRITLEDRLIYRVAGSSADQRLEIAQCRFHY